MNFETVKTLVKNGLTIEQVAELYSTTAVEKIEPVAEIATESQQAEQAPVPDGTEKILAAIGKLTESIQKSNLINSTIDQPTTTKSIDDITRDIVRGNLERK